MANSAVVGLLRALLVADTAEFDAAMRRAEDSAKAWSKSLKTVGAEAQAVGTTLTAGLTLPLVGLAAGASKLAIDFESSFAGVRKTVDATAPELDALSAQFRTLAKTIPISVNEINKLGETAGSLGVPTAAIAGFVEVMAGLGVATNLTADEAANAIARIQTIFGAAGKDTDRFAATLVGLGNAGASTEKEIVEMAQRISGAGHAIGLTQAQVLSLSSAMAGLGINAEAGGSSMSRILTKMNQAVAAGGAELDKWAKAAKQSTADFAAAFEKGPAEALTRVVEGLATAGAKQATVVQGLVGKNTTLLDTFQRLAGAGDNLRKTLALGDEEWQKNTALTNETSKRYETMASQLTILWNKLQDVGISLGQALLPTLKLVMGAFEGVVPILESLVAGFTALPAPVQAIVIGLGAIAAAAGPMLILFGAMVSGLGTLVGAFKTGGIAAVAFSETLLFIQANPIVLLLAGLAALGVAIYAIATSESELEKQVRQNTAAFSAETTALDRALTTYHELQGKQQLTKEETKRLEDATRLLAEASGLSGESFKTEMAKSDDLNRALQDQLKTRQDLVLQQQETQRNRVRDAQKALDDAVAERNKILQGKGTVHVAGQTFEEPGFDVAMTIGEQASAELKLRKEIGALTIAMEKEKATLDAMLGVKKADTAATTAAAAAAKAKADAVEEETKAEKKQREALEKAGRAISEAGVADKIAEMNAQILVANKYGGLAQESWKKYANQIDEWLTAGYKVGPLLEDFRHQHMDLVTTQIKVTDTTKALLAQFHNYAPEIIAAGDRIQELAAKSKVFTDLLNKPIDFSKFGTAISATELWAPHEAALKKAREQTDAWAQTFGREMSGLWTEIGGGLTDMLVAGLSGAQTFSDGFVNLWEGIKKKLTNIFADILNLFINGLIRGMIGAMTGQQGAFSQAFAGLAGTGSKSLLGTVLGGGAGAGGAAGMNAALPGTAVAGYGSASAAHAGLIGSVGGSVAGAGAGGAVGYYVGYRSGSTTQGVGAGAATGATVGGIFGGPIGMGVGAGVGALAGWYGAVQAGKEVNKIRDAFSASQGSIEAIHARLQAIGREDLFAPFAFGERNVDAIKEAIGNIQEVFEKINKVMQKVAVSFGKLNTAAATYGRTLPASLREGIKALMDNKDLTDEMRANLSELARDPSWQELESRAKDLGIDLAALGPKFQQARLGEIALGYVRDLKMFSDAGADMDGVLKGMADELSTLYQEAKTSGVALPESLRPYMQRLVELGLLLDDNGEKITDLNSIAFKEIEDKALTDIVNVLKEIKDLLERQLPEAARTAADGINDAFSRIRPPNLPDSGTAVPRPPPSAGSGAPGPPSSDTAVPRPEIGLQGGTHGQYVDWGSGTPVMLYGKEAVTPIGEIIAGPQAPINITVISTLDGKEIARNQVRHLPRTLSLAGL